MREEIIAVSKRLDKNAPLQVHITGISYCDGRYCIKRPNSNIHCFEYIIKGTGTVKCGSQTFTASAGDVYILQKGLNHHYFSDSKNPWEKIWFNISGTLADSLIHIYGLDNIHHIENLDLKSQFFSFVEVAKTDLSKDEMFKRLELIFHSIVQEAASAANSKKSTLATDIKNIIDRNIEGKIKMSDIAARAYCTPHHAIRVFSKEYGVTPYEYIMREKIRVAKLLLKSSAMPINEIAEKLSFCDEHYFSNVFKKRCNISPIAYRKSITH